MKIRLLRRYCSLTLYCSFRAYSSDENNLYGNLHMPSNNFCYFYIHQLEELFEKILKIIVLREILAIIFFSWHRI